MALPFTLQTFRFFTALNVFVLPQAHADVTAEYLRPGHNDNWLFRFISLIGKHCLIFMRFHFQTSALVKSVMCIKCLLYCVFYWTSCTSTPCYSDCSFAVELELWLSFRTICNISMTVFNKNQSRTNDNQVKCTLLKKRIIIRYPGQFRKPWAVFTVLI